MRQVADILQGVGFIKDREDIWYLKRGEIRDALWDHVTSWATGIKPRGPSYWPPEIEWRKGVLEKFKQWTPPPALGVPPDVVTEPFSIMLWGITTDVLKKWLQGAEAAAGGGEADELLGAPGSSGVVEGPARVYPLRGRVGRIAGWRDPGGHDYLPKPGSQPSPRSKVRLRTSADPCVTRPSSVVNMPCPRSSEPGGLPLSSRQGI